MNYDLFCSIHKGESNIILSKSSIGESKVCNWQTIVTLSRVKSLFCLLYCAKRMWYINPPEVISLQAVVRKSWFTDGYWDMHIQRKRQIKMSH